MSKNSEFKSALAQFSVPAELDAALEKGARFAGEAAQTDAHFIGFTELAFRPFFPQFRADRRYFDWAEDLSGKTVKFWASTAEKLGIDCAINFFERAGRGRHHDTTVICCADGELHGPVRMMHAAEEPGYNEKYYYWQGDTPPEVFDLEHAKVGVAICYDRHFPEYMRSLVLQGAEVIFAPFAGLKDDPLNMYEIEMQGFAFQHQVFIACVNRAGDEQKSSFAGGSFIVAPDGSVVARAGSDDELLVANLNLNKIEELRIQRPFLRDRRPRFYREFFNN